MPGDYLVISSSYSLARDIVDALDREIERTVKPLAQTHSLLELEGVQLASILQANRQTLIRGDMVNKGNTQEESEAQIDLWITLAKFFKSLKLSIGMHEGTTEASLEMKLNL